MYLCLCISLTTTVSYYPTVIGSWEATDIEFIRQPAMGVIYKQR